MQDSWTPSLIDQFIPVPDHTSEVQWFFATPLIGTSDLRDLNWLKLRPAKLDWLRLKRVLHRPVCFMFEGSRAQTGDISRVRSTVGAFLFAQTPDMRIRPSNCYDLI